MVRHGCRTQLPRFWRGPGADGVEYGEWTFYIVEDSSWIAAIREESPTLVGDVLTHYAIYTPEDCLDVVSHDDPEVAWL